MKFTFIRPTAELQPYISSYGIFESKTGIPTNNSFVVPNERFRIVIPFENSLTIHSENKAVTGQAPDLFLSGLWSVPTTISSTSQETRTIGIDLSPRGLYRFFTLNMREITNHVYSFDDLFGAWGRRLQHALGNIESPQSKIAFLQNALIYQLRRNTQDYSLIDHTVDLIMRSQGMIRIRSLETETGYSSRYLDMLFQRYVGVSPKFLANTIRFQRFFKLWAKTDATTFFRDELYASYFDESHFIKEFKRFTGYSPLNFAQRNPEFSRAFYSQWDF